MNIPGGGTFLYQSVGDDVLNLLLAGDIWKIEHIDNRK